MELLPPTPEAQEWMFGPNLERILKSKKTAKLPILDALNDYYNMVRKSSLELTTSQIITIYETEEKGGYVIMTPRKYVAVQDKAVPPFILCSDNPLSKGFVEGFLREANGIADCLGVDIDSSDRLIKLMDTLKLSKDPKVKEILDSLKEEGSEEAEILGTLSHITPSTFRLLKLDTFIPEVGEFVLRRWEEFKAQLFKPYDPWIREVYRAYLTPFPNAGLAPHIFLITPSGVGKSWLATSIGEEWDDVTVASLVGGYYDGKVRIGLLHNKDYLVQIGKFESKDQDALGHLHNVIALGESIRASGAKRIRVVFRGAIIFTNNANMAVEVPLIELVSKLSNPIALGTRFIPLINTRLVYANRALMFNKHAVREALEAVRGLVRPKIRRFYNELVVREWLDEEPDEWDELRSRIMSREYRDENLKAYIKSFSREGWRKVKALALARALSERLDSIWRDEVTTQQILELAEDYLGDLGSGYMRMVRSSLEDVEELYEEDLKRLAAVLDREKFLDYFLDALVDLVRANNSGLEALTANRAVIDIGEVRRLVEARAKAEGKKWKLSNDRFIKKVLGLKTKPETRIVVEVVGLRVDETNGKIEIRARDLLNLKSDLDRLRE